MYVNRHLHKTDGTYNTCSQSTKLAAGLNQKQLHLKRLIHIKDNGTNRVGIQTI